MGNLMTTNDAPTVPGYYWATCRDNASRRFLLHVRLPRYGREGIGELRAFRCGRQESFHLCGFVDWSGPIVDPEIPSTLTLPADAIEMAKDCMERKCHDSIPETIEAALQMYSDDVGAHCGD